MKSENFEKALKRLENLIQQLERGDLPLEQALQTFEEGMRLVRFCTKKLDEVEKKVEILLQDEEGRLITRPFNVSEEDLER
ncbi:MAG: exodeoxyribonuclease VII small subunit [Deltaproteobacteria bacterium]|nr:exodeoxyribonuclease VII small subunit [Deltaproteobacteria bacterium]MBW1952492.1 exodeoxyribonuclease VII small subunit [Deltaproteobacteria bacterium]MBW1987343.1 exodeoxyribonuclease VII small subunit [Deltaproteobacteria bacterium]MBW2135305.1 exodeoxyribonuclease VII small subunit [Deltaproteobacteria bacterium]